MERNGHENGENSKDNISMSFQVKCDSTKFGDNVYVTGNLDSLGNWKADKAVPLNTNATMFPLWESNPKPIKFEGDNFEYKYIIKGNNQIRWEDYPGNRKVFIKDITGREKVVTLIDESFGVNKKPKIVQGNGNPINSGKNIDLVKQIHERAKKASKFEYINFEIPPHLQTLIKTFVKLNEEKKTWKEKLSFVWDLLPKNLDTNEKDSDNLPDKELLALISVYLYFINTGQIKCSENGTHFRPNHHSSLAYSIFTYLYQIQTGDNSIITRSILKNLPSFADQYMVSVPLTRIRDIAHRGDIPHDLKQEIKNTLQNKLHRSASPDDLTTCENILQRITAPGTSYSSDFVNEFKIFYEELKEFFNALGLEKALEKIKEQLPSDYNNVKSEIDKMMSLKRESIDKSINKLEQIVKLRKIFNGIVKDGLGFGNIYNGNKNTNINKSLLQISSTGEVELENFSYAVMSEFIERNYYQSQRISEEGYGQLFTLLDICLDSFIISNIKSEECEYIQKDIDNFVTKSHFSLKKTVDINSNPDYRLAVLKVKAVLERCQNLFYEIADDVQKFFTIPAHSLGKQLNIQPHSVQIFCESFIRSHTIFQFSKIISLLLNKIRDILNLPPFVTISPGFSQGYFLHLEKLADFNPNKHDLKEYIVFLDESDGSEEIPNEIKGVVLAHDLPQLSHLAIRARQNKAPCVCVLDMDIYKYQYLKQFKYDDYIYLDFKNDENIKIEKSNGKKEITPKKDENEDGQDHLEENESCVKEEQNSGEEGDEDQEVLLPIIKAEKRISGSKCANMRELAQIKEDLFETPLSFNIPYYVYTKYADKVVNKEDYKSIDTCQYEKIETVSSSLREKLIHTATSREFQVYVNDLELIAQSINEQFPMNTPLAIRSSSNLEDLKKSAGAGLFDSYLGILNTPENKEEIKLNICRVWASLFTQRGIIARRNNKIPSSLAKMGVLVQEMINPDFAFVIHTVNPITRNDNHVYIEIAIGLGETLASAKQRGSPYRLIYYKKEDAVEINNYASYSMKIKNGNDFERVSYKSEILSNNDEYLIELGRRLGKISLHLEDNFKCPQDVEGGVYSDKIYLMQTRPQIL